MRYIQYVTIYMLTFAKKNLRRRGRKTPHYSMRKIRLPRDAESLPLVICACIGWGAAGHSIMQTKHQNIG